MFICSLKGEYMNKQEKDKRNKRKKARKNRKDSPKYKLRIFWHKHRSNFSARNLVLLAREIDYPEIQKSVLREFLSRINLTFADFYRVLGLPKEVLELDSRLENTIWRQCFDICTPDNLLELIDLGEAKAAQELFERIDKKSISMRKAKQILIFLFKRTDDKKLTEELWRRIEAIGPNEDELKYLLDLEKASQLHRHIEKLLAKRAERKTGVAITKIRQFVEQIKQGQA